MQPRVHNEKKKKKNGVRMARFCYMEKQIETKRNVNAFTNQEEWARRKDVKVFLLLQQLLPLHFFSSSHLRPSYRAVCATRRCEMVQR